MATELTTIAKALTTGVFQSPQLVLEIEGINTKFGIGTIKKYVKIGDDGLLIEDDWKIGGYNAVTDQEDLVSFDGSTTTISQQLLQDKGGVSSISSIQIALIDKNSIGTDLVSPNVGIDGDILGRNAIVWLGNMDTAFPQDFVPLFLGIVSEIGSGSTIILTVSHPEQQKRSSIFEKQTTELDGDLTIDATTITVLSTADFLEPADSGTLRTYIRIEDEIIEYTGKTDTTFTGCTRGAFYPSYGKAIAATHEDEASVESFYRLSGEALDLALKIMLSGKDDDYENPEISIKNFVDTEEVGEIENAIYFEGLNIKDRYGIVSGDLITITGDLYSQNNVTSKEVSDVQVTQYGSYIIVDGVSFVTSKNSDAVCTFVSKYDVLPQGASLGLSGEKVDVPEFERIRTLFTTSLLTYDFYLKDTITAKDFIDTEILFPTGGYSLPRKGKISMGFTNPPLRVADLVKLDHTNTVKPENNKFTRSISKYFYNNVTFIFNESPLDDKFYNSIINISADSKNQIKNVGNVPLTIKAKGIRNNTDSITRMSYIASRLLDRYQFAAECITIKSFYGPTYNIDAGDAVLFGSPELNLIDTKNASREFKPRLFETVNKSMTIKTGDVQLVLADTNYLTSGRYGIFSPASKLNSGSTTTKLKLKSSYQTDDYTKEKSKWVDYIGEKVMVHSLDWTFVEETRLKSFDATNSNVMNVYPALSVAPSENYIVEIPNYFFDEVRDTDGAIYKNVHCFSNPSIQVESSIDTISFMVSEANAAILFAGATIRLHSEDFSDYSDELIIDSVSGQTVTLKTDADFTPTSNHYLELIGFVSDEGVPYRYL